MRAVGEALGLGRTFPEAFLKALEGREDGAELPEIPGLHPYFAAELDSIREAERTLAETGDVAAAKRFGLPDAWIARALGLDEGDVRRQRSAARPARRRLVRGRVRGQDAVLLPLVRGGRLERRGLRTPERRRDRLGPEPDRAGHRVRLLLRPRGAGLPPARLRGRAAELQPGDGLDRLRHLRPALPRAGHARARARRLRASSSHSASSSRSGARPRSSIAHGLAEAGVPLLGDPLLAIDLAEDRGKFGAVLEELGLRAPRWGRRRESRRGARGRRADRLSGARAAPLRSRRAPDARRSRPGRSSRSTSPRSSTSSSKGRSSSTSTSSATASRPGSPGSSSTSSRPESTRATRPA